MMPIGPLMVEHRLIEKMLRKVELAAAGIGASLEIDLQLVDTAVDFIRNYADRCHHGKEEDILFRELKKKKLSPEEERLMEELIEEHLLGRRTVGRLVAARDAYAAGDSSASAEIRDCLAALAAFYPKHIEKEDKHFFIPIMRHFSREEQEAMLAEGNDFDCRLIHAKYQELVDKYN